MSCQLHSDRNRMIEEFYSFASCMSARSAVPPGDEALTVFFTVPDFNNIKYNYSSGISQLTANKFMIKLH